MLQDSHNNDSYVIFVGILSKGMELHFEPKDGGFFLRTGRKSDSQLSTMNPDNADTWSESQSGGQDESNSEEEIRMEQFTVLPSYQPVSIRVMYGPFSTKQTVPVRLLVPDPLENLNNNGSGEPEMIPPLDLSAHLVTHIIPKDTPILRVLFHAGQTAFKLPMTAANAPRQVSPNTFLPCFYEV